MRKNNFVCFGNVCTKWECGEVLELLVRKALRVFFGGWYLITQLSPLYFKSEYYQIKELAQRFTNIHLPLDVFIGWLVGCVFIVLIDQKE